MDEETQTEDIYAAQREELMVLLRRMKASGEPLILHGEMRLTCDDAVAVLQKLGRDLPFSRRERTALTEAGFDLERLFPRL